MKEKAILCTFFDRLEISQRMITHLLNAMELGHFEVYLFCDRCQSDSGDQKVRNDEVIEFLNKVSKAYGWNLCIRENHAGLYLNLIGGIEEVLAKHEALIVLEDDILISENCLQYFERALDYYKDDPRVFGIGGNSFVDWPDGDVPDTIWLPITTSWCWGTWSAKWSGFEHDLELWVDEQLPSIKAKFDFGGYPYSKLLTRSIKNERKSWAVEYYAHVFRNAGFFVFPKYSLCANIGLGNFATNTKNTNLFFAKITNPSFCPGHFDDNPRIDLINFAKSDFAKKLQLNTSELLLTRAVNWFKRLFS